MYVKCTKCILLLSPSLSGHNDLVSKRQQLGNIRPSIQMKTNGPGVLQLILYVVHLPIDQEGHFCQLYPTEISIDFNNCVLNV